MRFNRRELIAMLLGVEVAATVGCSRGSLPTDGDLLHTSFAVGHQIRDGYRTRPAPSEIEEVGVVIVGGGMAGLSAAWRLLDAGVEDFVLLELESRPGGTARGGRKNGAAFPWGAHYVPAPMRENRAMVKLLGEMNVLERIADDGTPVIAEQFLCRDPHERLFHDGQWHEGIYPSEGATDDDLRELNEFRVEIDRWVEARDDSGRRMFAIPLATGSDDPQTVALDQISMSQWMDEHQWTSPRLRWMVNYACRDDYGLSIDKVSAWAGVFYFAARVRSAGEESQSVITWPEGNGRIADFPSQRVGERLRCSVAVTEVVNDDADGKVSVFGLQPQDGKSVGLRADRVIFAAPQFLASRACGSLLSSAGRDPSSFQYGSWLVANVHLKDRPVESSFPMCWDNVLYDSRSLGYVTATHQIGVDYGPTVLTWYYPFADVDPRVTREQMLRLKWADWADLVMSDLRLAHPDIDTLTSRIDIMCWGHAMIQPRVGFVWSEARRQAAEPIGAVHFAGTDLSGIPLFEEAFYHGIRAAEEVLAARNIEHPSIL